MGVLEQGQIHSTFISFIIDGTQYGSINSGITDIYNPKWSPQAITSLTVTKTTAVDAEGVSTPAGLKVEIELDYIKYPNFYEKIIELITQNPGGSVPAKLQYGYVNGEVSPIYDIIMQKCEPTDMWRSLKLTFIQDSTTTNKFNTFTEKTKKLIDPNEYLYYDLSNFVQDIAMFQEWDIGEITPTKPNTDENGERQPIYVEDRTSPLAMINELLRRYPNESEAGEGRYVATFKYTVDGLKFYFVPTRMVTEEHKYVDETSTYEFFVNALPQGKVISFDPVLETAVGEAANKVIRGDRPDIGTVTTDSRELINIIYNMENRKAINTASEPECYEGFMNADGLEINVEKPNLTQYMRSLISGNLNQYVNTIGVRNSAKMEVLGDPTLNVMDYINVMAFYPVDIQTDTKVIPKGKLHPTSGTYRIDKIVDSISGGSFSSSLELAADAEKNFGVGGISTAVLQDMNSFKNFAHKESEEG